MTSYVVCGSKSWNKRVFDEKISKLPGQWHYVGSKEELTLDSLKKLNPRFIFFLHWSWKVLPEVFNAYECINFHMTDVPYGRGGSPLQNLILRGHKETKLSALKMEEGMDTGPVYLKEDLSLEGSAQEILERSSEVAVEMIETIISKEIEPSPQEGEVVEFSRRKPEESKIPTDLTPEKLADFIRMLDGDGYPPAFFDKNGFRYIFRNARMADQKTLTADVTIIPTL